MAPAFFRFLRNPAPWLLALIIVAAVILLYGPFLWNPLVFDDMYFFLDAKTAYEYGHSFFHFDLRWLPYASLGWTANLLGLDLIWFRLGNLLLHVANVIALFIFLRKLLSAIQPTERGLSAQWLAFFGALIFALHPVAVYGAGYLIQRTILMATLFVLLMAGFYFGLIPPQGLRLFH